MPTSIGNIKITNNDQILHWWKLNSRYDEGLNDEDFYTFWHSICEIFGAIYAQTDEITDVENVTELTKKFLTSFGIRFNQSTTDADIKTLYSLWTNDISRRGTVGIMNRKNLSTGLALRLDSENHIVTIYNSGGDIETGNIYTFEFDFKVEGDTPSGKIYFSENNPPNHPYTIWYTTSGGGLYFYFFEGVRYIRIPIDNEIHHIKMVVSNHDLYVYMDGILVLTAIGVVISEGQILISGSVFIKTDLTGNGFLRIGNINLTSGGMLIPMNRRSFFIYDQSLKVNMRVVCSGSLESLYADDDDFNNIVPSAIDGELIRMLKNTSSDELIFPLLAKPDLDWNINNASPQSTQTYPIENFNKFYNKRKFSHIDNLPLYYTDQESYGRTSSYRNGMDALGIHPYSGQEVGIGVNATNIYNISKYLIPVEETLDYEISFRMRSPLDARLELRFGAIGYTSSLVEILPKSAVSAGESETLFIDPTLAWLPSLLNVKDVWIRGILYNKNKVVGTDTTRTNLDIPTGRNLIMRENTKYIIPKITFVSVFALASPIYVWDIQVRPLKLNTSKGTIGMGNVILPYLNNNGDYSNSEVNRIVKNEMVPHDALVKIKFL